MQFPLFQTPYAGNGMTIGLNATVHVMISHGIAIGVFAMVGLADYIGMRNVSGRGEQWRAYAYKLLKFAVMMVTVAGAVTGAGIWFTTSALAPRGIGSMLRIFFWSWFTEWIVFVLEVFALLLYYFYWNKLERYGRWRSGLGFGYMLLAFASAVLITGNLGFMLTSGNWPQDRTFWEGFFNPSFLPQLMTRLSLALVLGSILSMLILLITMRDADFVAEALRTLGALLLISLFAFALSLAWYVNAAPKAALVNVPFSVLSSHLSQWPNLLYAGNILGALILLALGIAAARSRARSARVLVIPALLAFAGMIAEFERIREFIRGPYLMPGYMYANTILIEEQPLLDRRGLLDNSYWYNAAYPKDSPYSASAYIFGQTCSVCHTIGGLNDIRARIRGRSEDGLYVILGHTHEMVSFMAPFNGTDEERRDLARFLYHLSADELTMESRARFIPARAPSEP